MKAHTKTRPLLSVYLGPEPVATKRLQNLDKLAERLGTNRSKLIQMLADGRLTLIVPLEDSPNQA